MQMVIAAMVNLYFDYQFKILIDYYLNKNLFNILVSWKELPFFKVCH